MSSINTHCLSVADKNLLKILNSPFLQNKFWERVDKTKGACWLWTKGKTPKGYGAFHPSTGLKVAAHRVSFTLHHKRLPKNECLLHTCDVRLCCNPEHLVEGSYADNVMDMYAKGRAVHIKLNLTHCIRGHKYTEENTYIKKSNGGKVCKQCANLSITRNKF